MNNNRNIIKLVCISSDGNNNKFYIMTKLNSTEWEAQWGRIKGELAIDVSAGQKKIYPMKDWEKFYEHKTGDKKGYKDVTHLYEEILKDPSAGNKGEDPTAMILNAAVRKLMIDLQRFASISVKENYSVSVENVTQRMVDEAQLILGRVSLKIVKDGNVKDVNNDLLELYRIIPRKMKKVSYHLVDSLSTTENIEYVQKMIRNEQSTLDVMASQVKLKNQSESSMVTVTEQKSLLEQMGLTVEHITGKEVEFVKTLAGENAKRIKNIFKVIHKASADKYDNHFKELRSSKEQMLFHGSRNQNWFHILQNSLLIRPVGAIHTGSMFGDGLYFANKMQKAIGYTSTKGAYWTSGSQDTGFIALFKCNVGKQKDIHHHTSDCKSLSHTKVQKDGYDSVYAHGGFDLRNDEFILYKSEKCTIAYIIEIS